MGSDGSNIVEDCTRENRKRDAGSGIKEVEKITFSVQAEDVLEVLQDLRMCEERVLDVEYKDTIVLITILK